MSEARPPVALGPDLALLVVDMQRDFMSTGPVPVAGAESLCGLINRLGAAVAAGGGATTASLDWHPADHVSFVSTHPGRALYDTVHVEVPGHGAMPVTLFNSHCVADSPGADFTEGLDTSFHHIVRKGRRSGLESFSAFHDMARAESTDLAAWLRARGVRRLLVGGVATEYCVRATVLDALSEGFQTALATDAAAGVDAAGSEKALREMEAAGATLVSGEELLRLWAGAGAAEAS